MSMTATKTTERPAPTGLKLYQLPGAFDAIDRAIDEAGGEVSPEIEAELDRLEATLEEKAEGVAYLIAQAQAEEAFFAAEISKLSSRKAVAANRAAALKAYLFRTLVASNRDRVDGRRYKIRVQRNPAPAIAWTRDPDEIPAPYRRVAVTLDGALARAAYKALGALPEGFEITHGSHLRIS